MTAYLNPLYGDDATAELGNRFRPFKTPKAVDLAFAAAFEAADKDPAKQGGHQTVISYKPVPVEPEPETPPAHGLDGDSI